VSRIINQRELCNDSAAVLRDVQARQTIVVTRNGVPVAELRPIAPRRFVPRSPTPHAMRRRSMRGDFARTSTRSWIKPSMAEPTRGGVDTSVVVDLDEIDPAQFPDESAIAAITLAELAAGPLATTDEQERARRQDRLQWAAATWDALPIGAARH